MSLQVEYLGDDLLEITFASISEMKLDYTFSEGKCLIFIDLSRSYNWRHISVSMRLFTVLLVLCDSSHFLML